MMDEPGLTLLRSIESLMKQLVEEQQRCRNDAEKLAALRKASNARSTKSKARKRGVNVAEQRVSNVAPASISTKALKLEKRKNKDLPSSGEATLLKTGEHSELIAHFGEAVQRAAGVPYEFGAEDGKHAATLLRRFGLPEGKRLVDLAVNRFQREPFYRNLGLTLRLVANDANKLRTANGTPQANGMNTPIWKKQGFGSPEEYAAHLEAIPLDPPLVSAGGKA